MKISKELDEALEKIAREVEGWPAWKRSVDLRDLKKLSEMSENHELTEKQNVLVSRAAKA
jgi:hypothetical protein